MAIRLFFSISFNCESFFLLFLLEGILRNSRRRRVTPETAHHAFKCLQQRIMWCDLGSSQSGAWREEDLARIFRGTIYRTTNYALHFRKSISSGKWNSSLPNFRNRGQPREVAQIVRNFLPGISIPFDLSSWIFGRMVRFSSFVKDFSERSTTRSFSVGNFARKTLCTFVNNSRTVQIERGLLSLKSIFIIMNREIILVYSAKKPKQFLRLSDKTLGDFGLASSRPISILPVDATIRL